MKLSSGRLIGILLPILLISILGHKEIPTEVIGEPHMFRKDDILGYNFLIGGIFYIFFVSKKKAPSYVLENTINENNEMNIIHMKQKDALRFTKRYFGIK